MSIVTLPGTPPLPFGSRNRTALRRSFGSVLSELQATVLLP